MNPRNLATCLLTATLIAPAARAQDVETDPVADLLSANRLAFEVTEDGMAGAGATFLLAEAAESQFVLIGERHGTQETPRFAAHLMKALRPAGYDIFCIEIGHITAHQLEPLFAAEDPMASLEKLNTDYPFTVAFYNWREECEALIDALDTGYRFWGLDQEFAGSGRYLLNRLIELAPNEEARTLASAWKDKAVAGFTKLMTQGKQDEAFLMSITPADFDELDRAFAGDDTEVTVILRELRASAHIYQLFVAGQYYQSNYDRIQLMKNHFHEHARRYERGDTAKAVFKFGDVHMGRGYSDLNQLDLGNMAAELACARGGDSLHLRVYARKFINPDGSEQDLLPMRAGLAPCFDFSSPEEWVVLDLRPLRDHFHDDRNRKGREELADLVFRYDLIVIAPEFHAATELVPMQMPG